MSKIIFTNHVKNRLYDRKISEDQVFQTINSADNNFPNGDRLEYKKRFGQQVLTAITKQSDNGEYIVLSAWIDPPNSGTKDEKKRSRYFESKKAGTFKKFWLTLLNQLGV